MGEFAEELAANATAGKEVGKNRPSTVGGGSHTKCKAGSELVAAGQQDPEEHWVGLLACFY